MVAIYILSADLIVSRVFKIQLGFKAISHGFNKSKVTFLIDSNNYILNRDN